MQRKVDSFQWRIIRTFVLNVRWLTIVKSEEIFTKTKLKIKNLKIALRWYWSYLGAEL